MDIAACTIHSICSIDSQGDSGEVATITKEGKKICKDLKKNGWKVYGNTTTLETAINRYYQLLAEGDGCLYPLMGEASAADENQALRKAQYHANAQYAAQLGTQVNSMVDLKVSNDASNEAKTRTEFDQTVQTKVNQQVKSLRPEVSLIRTREDGRVEAKLLFLINKSE